MGREEIATLLLTTDTRLRVDEVVIRFPDGITKKARGTLWRDAEEEKFHLHLTLLEGSLKLPFKGGVFTREHFWRIEGVIEEMVPFHCEAPPGLESNSADYVLDRHAYFVKCKPQTVSLVPPLTPEREAERIARWKEGNEMLSRRVPEPEDYHPTGLWSASVFIPGVKAVHLNEGTEVEEKNPLLGTRSRSKMSTLNGEWEARKIGMVQHEDSCEIVLREEEGGPESPALDDFEKELDALLRAFGFVNGWDPWWQRLTVRRGGDVVRDDVRALRAAPSSCFAPLTERACHFGGDAVQLTGLAWNFFRTDPAAEILSQALYLMRQATQHGVPTEIGLLAQCTVFEGVVDMLYKRWRSPNDAAVAAAFEQAAKATQEFVSSRLLKVSVPSEQSVADTAETKAWTRLNNFVKAARMLRPEDKFREVCRHCRLDEKQFVQPILKAWQSYRNALAHGKTLQGPPAEIMFASSRLAGGYYILLAKLFGYSGKMVFSQLEDREADLRDPVHR